MFMFMFIKAANINLIVDHIMFKLENTHLCIEVKNYFWYTFFMSIINNKKYTILAIDDTAENLGLLETLLENQNYQVLVATNGERGLNIVQKQHPDIILLDVMMPGWNGFETARKIKEIPELSHIPILFLSALDDSINKVKGFDAGGVDYIAKPFQQVDQNVQVLFFYHL